MTPHEVTAMARIGRYAGVGPLLIASLSACTPSDQPSPTREEAQPRAVPEPPPPPGFAHSQASKPGDPISRGEANSSGLSPDQIDLMFAKAFEQKRPFAEHRAVCLSIATAADGSWQRDPPASALASFRTLTRLPVLPASQCAFDTHPYVIANREPAMLYSVVVETQRDGEPIAFWANATFGNLGAEGAKYILRRSTRGWHADPTQIRSIS